MFVQCQEVLGHIIDSLWYEKCNVNDYVRGGKICAGENPGEGDEERLSLRFG